MLVTRLILFILGFLLCFVFRSHEETSIQKLSDFIIMMEYALIAVGAGLVILSFIIAK